MGFPRGKYVQEGEEGVYHCISRCVRRAYLFGVDPLTGRDYSHRKGWIVERLKYLASIFAIDVCAYAVLWTHFHNILRTRPDIVAGWSDLEVAARWLKLYPKRAGRKGKAASLTEEDMIRALASCPGRIAELRKRLCSLSWFMGRLNEHIARAANKEDDVKGRFWESRFKCQVLLDEAAIVSGMVYVDLNLIRAGLAATPEESDFASIQERIRAWQEETMGSREAGPVSEAWLCPIASESGRRGILQMTALEYFDLVDRSGRIIRSDKRGAIDAELAPILQRIGANPEAWLETISGFESKFCLAAGLVSSLRSFADRLGRRWIKGVGMARTLFASSPPRMV